MHFRQASADKQRTFLKKAAKDECATSSVHSTLHIPMHPARAGLMHPPCRLGAARRGSALRGCSGLTYGMEPSKYILTAFGRILMGGPLSVLCLTASSFFVACCGPHFTRMYRVTRSPIPRVDGWWFVVVRLVFVRWRSLHSPWIPDKYSTCHRSIFSSINRGTGIYWQSGETFPLVPCKRYILLLRASNGADTQGTMFREKYRFNSLLDRVVYAWYLWIVW